MSAASKRRWLEAVGAFCLALLAGMLIAAFMIASILTWEGLGDGDARPASRTLFPHVEGSRHMLDPQEER